MSNKALIVLNSGGFDSTVLIHKVRQENPEAEIHALFFNYGQPNAPFEEMWAEEHNKQVSAKSHVVELPPIAWTSRNFYGNDFSSVESQYLEYRNLIFISYAFSLAQSINSSEVYMAILKSHYGYSDTSRQFFDAVNSIDQTIKVVTPFIEVDKVELTPLAFNLGIKPRTYHSCDIPNEGKPCGACPDCKVLAEIEEELTVDTAIKAWRKSADPFNPCFQRGIKTAKVDELRLLINNDCQLKCKHCFYGFEETLSPILPREVLFESVRDAIDLGVSNIHISGKEPLFDESFMWYAKQIKAYSPPTTIDIVTNGINVPKYAELMKECGVDKVFLSIDEVLDTNGYRSVKGVYEKSLQALFKVGLPVEVFIDLHENNFDKVGSILETLHEKGVRTMYVRVIKPIGNAEKNSLNMLNLEQVEESFKQCIDFTPQDDTLVTFNFGVKYTYDFLEAGEDFATKVAISDVLNTGSTWVTHNLQLNPEAFCEKYSRQLTLTPDGYVLGCGTEVSHPRYDLLSAGNIKNLPLSEIIKRGKEICIKCNEKQVDNNGNLLYNGCTHSVTEV